MNVVVLIGNLTKNPELRYTGTGTAVSDLGLAVNDKRKDADGNMIDNTVFCDVTVWGKQAENCNKYLMKGSQIAIQGKLKLDTWENSEGQKRSKLRVTADRVQFIGGKRSTDNGSSKPAAETVAVGAGSGAETDVDIPFYPNLL